MPSVLGWTDNINSIISNLHVKESCNFGHDWNLIGVKGVKLTILFCFQFPVLQIKQINKVHSPFNCPLPFLCFLYFGCCLNT